MNTYLDVVCYRSKLLADGTSPIMLRLTKDGKRKYISLHLSANQSQWDFKKNQPKRNCPDREAILTVIERKSKQYHEQITQFKAEGKDYTLETLVQRVENPVRQMNFGDYLEHCVDVLKAENRYGYARNLDELRASILHFRKTLDFYFSYIDLRWLRGYELYLRSRGIAGDIQHSRHT